MRNLFHKIMLLTAALMIMAVPVLANEGVSGTAMESAQQGTKNECLLVAMNCGDQVDTIQQRIDRIQKEINRGADVYTNDELKRLRNQLDEANRNFDNLNGGA